MSWDDYIDAEIINNPMYWLIVIGTEILSMVGFKTQSLWGNGTTPILITFATLLLIPVMGYLLLKYWILR